MSDDIDVDDLIERGIVRADQVAMLTKKPRMQWTPLAPDRFRVTALDGRHWELERTPHARRPWLLHSGGRRQEIGCRAVVDAQRQAEFWLEASRLVAATPAPEMTA